MHSIVAEHSVPLPSGKQPVPPGISTRAYIQWLPDPPSEPTSTHVLTSSGRFFVDIRILEEKDEGQEAKGDKVDSKSPPSNNDNKNNKIDWAFAGRSKSWQILDTTRSRWDHYVDSRFIDAESVLDEAEMQPGDPKSDLMLENGVMVNPATGKKTAYEEAWRETKIEVVPEASADFLEDFKCRLYSRGVKLVKCPNQTPRLVRGKQEATSRDLVEQARFGGGQPWGILPLPPAPLEGGGLAVCSVLKHEHPARRSRGMVVRVGQLCQGVMRVGEEFAAERWEWTAQSGWLKVFSSGDLDMPCDVACYLAVDMLRAGSRVTYSGRGHGRGENQSWLCVEEEQWEYVEADPGRYKQKQPAPVVVVGASGAR